MSNASQGRNNKEHIQWLLTTVKRLQREADEDRAQRTRERDIDRREINRLRERVEGKDSE